MSTNLHPRVAGDLIDNERRDSEKSESERALKRASDHKGDTADAPAKNSEDILKRAAENNDGRGKVGR